MSAGSAQEQIPTRTRWVRLGDLLVDARRDDAVDVDRLRDVLEGLLPEALEDEVVAPTSASPVLMPMWSMMGGNTPPYSSLRRNVCWWIANAARVAFSAWSVP